MAVNDPNRKHYFGALKPSDVFAFLDNCSKNKVLIQVWEQGKSEDHVEEFKIEKYSPESDRITIMPQGGLMAKLTGPSLVDINIFIKFLADKKLQYFSTGKISVEKDAEGKKIYYLKLNQSIYKGQQRSNFRLKTNEKRNILLKMANGKIVDCDDISVGGSSFIIEKKDLDQYPKNEVITDSSILFNNVKFDISHIKIAGHIPIEGDDTKIRIGLAFLQLSKGVEKALFDAINDEIRKDEIAKLLKKGK